MDINLLKAVITDKVEGVPIGLRWKKNVGAKKLKQGPYHGATR